MKLKVPIEREEIRYPENMLTSQQSDRNEMLDEVNQLEIIMDKNKLTNLIMRNAQGQYRFEDMAKAIIAAMPNIISIKKPVRINMNYRDQIIKELEKLRIEDYLMEIKEPKSPCCGWEMIHVPDNVHFHYQCERCCREFDLDLEPKTKKDIWDQEYEM